MLFVWLVLRRMPLMRRRSFVALLLAAVSVSGAFSLRAGAQTSDKKSQLQSQLNEATSEEQAATAQLNAAKTKLQQLSAQQAKLTAQANEATARLNVILDQIAQLDAEMNVIRGQISTVQADIDEVVDQARDTAVRMYKRPQGASMSNLITGGDGFDRLVEGSQYLERVSERRRQDLQKVARLKAELEDQQSLLDGKRKSADAARADADDAKRKADALVAEQAALVNQASAEDQKANSALATIKKSRADLEAQLQAENERLIRELYGLGGASLGTGQFLRPVPGPVTSPFGYRTHPITGAQSFHAGVDLGSPCGTPIKAADNAIVYSAGWNSGGYGNLTILNHGGGVTTLYGHQSSIAVTAGQAVVKGQTIGYVGTTGNSTGCHLHWEVRVNGNPVNPLAYV